jgi:two-component system cell cycle sensor histidine kinase/response regulator CckA
MDSNLKENEINDIANRYRIISEITSDFFYCLAIPADGPMRIVWVEGAYQRLTGYTAEDIRDSKDYQSIIHPEDLPVLQHAIGLLMNNRPHIFEYRIRTQSGQLRWVRDRAQPVWSDRENRVNYIIGAVENITERKGTETALKESEELFRSLVENMQDAAVIIDWDGTLLFANQAGADLVGLETPDEALGSNIAQFVHPDSRAKVVDDLVRIKQGLGSFLAEYRITTKDGTTKWVEGLGEKIIFKGISADLVIVRDINERKKAETALRESEERYRQFFLEDLSGAYITKPDGRMVACNPAFARIFGFASVQEALDTRMDAIYPESNSRADFLKVLKENKKLINYKSVMNRLDGSHLDIVENTIGVFDERGDLTEIKGFLVDVTRQMKLEEQLQKARKMETVGTLAGGIAHEFNNLLMTIQGNASLIQFDLDIADPHYQMLEKIEKAVNRGVKLTQQLLGYAKKGKYEIKSLNLNRLVKETADSLGSTQKDIAIHYELAANIAAIQGDQDQIEQVLSNLFTNAADAMSGKGKLLLKTSNVTHEHMEAKLYKPAPGDYVKLTVTDTGVGMDAATRDRIFDPFFTTKGMGQGKGLGLASAYGIIKSHGGYIEVESEKGHGSIFSIFLPTSRNKIWGGPPTALLTQERDGLILMADDEDLVLGVGVNFLNRLGYTTLTAKNGREAVEIYQKNHDVIDMVILDMIMPQMGGGQAYDNLKKINPEVKVLLSSGYSLDGQAREILDRGCNGFIQKPFSMEALAAKIDEILTD